MRILFNLSAALFAQRTGVGHHAAELYRALRALAAPVRRFPSRTMTSVVRLLHSQCSQAHTRAVNDRAERLRAARPAGSRSPLAWLGWRLRMLRVADRSRVRLCRNGERLVERYTRRCLTPHFCDLYHEPNYIPMECEVPAVATIHDLSALLHPEWHPADRVKEFEASFRAGLGRCAHFLAVSEFTRQEVIRTLGVAPDRVTRAWNGVRPGMRPLSPAESAPVLRRLGLTAGGYLLFVGTLEPRKNLDTLLRAHADMPAGPRERCPLVLAGGWGWHAEGLRGLVEGEARHRGVIHLGYTAEADLPALYSGARALAFPSLYEGFGLPPVEMMACGGAVLASTAGAVAEVVGDRAHLVEPLDVAGWRSALERAITDDGWLAGLRRGACEHAAQFTWDACARDTLAAYRAALNPGTPRAAAERPSAAP